MDLPTLEDIPKDELEHLRQIACDGGPAVRDALYRYALLRARKRRKARADAERDNLQRVLVGARLPRQEAWLIARAADLQGISLYRFCRDALMEKAQDITGISTHST